MKTMTKWISHLPEPEATSWPSDSSIKAFLTMTNSSVAILDLDFLCVNWLVNRKSGFEWVNYDRNNPLTIAEMIHPDDTSRLLRDIAHVKRFSLAEYESMYRLSDMEGQYFWDLARALPFRVDKDGRLTHAVVFIRHLNQALVNSDFIGQMIQSNQKDKAKLFDRKLTTREKDVLVLIGKAMTDEEIAKSLFISRKTVISHRRNLLRKLNARNKLELVKIVIENGLID